MEVSNLKWPWSALYRLFGRLNNKDRNSGRGMIVIAKSPLRSNSRRDNGEFIIKLDWSEVFAGFKLAAVLIGIVFLLSTTLYHALGRKR